MERDIRRHVGNPHLLCTTQLKIHIETLDGQKIRVKFLSEFFHHQIGSIISSFYSSIRVQVLFTASIPLYQSRSIIFNFYSSIRVEGHFVNSTRNLLFFEILLPGPKWLPGRVTSKLNTGHSTKLTNLQVWGIIGIIS